MTNVDEKYFQRCNYIPKCEITEFINRTPKTSWDTLYCDEYRIVNRAMLNLSGERTLISTIIPPNTSHIHTIFGLAFRDMKIIPSLAGALSSLPYDFFIKITNKGFASYDVMKNFPVIDNYDIAIRELLLVSLNDNYSGLWKKVFDNQNDVSWSKSDPRLDNKRFSTLTSEWTWDTPLRTDYERRQALVEIDVLTAMALGMTLEQLKTIYRIQFPVLQQYEADTWYDANGRIVFTTNRSLVGVGFDRKEWEGNVKGAMDGMVFTREIEDDTMPGGPVKRTIEYVAPFDKCDREQDYETAWRFFEEKYKQ